MGYNGSGLEIPEGVPHPMRSFFRETLITAIMALVIFTGLQFTVQNFPIEGSSMTPSFPDGQRLLVNKLIYRFFHEPQRGDVIVFKAPESPTDDYIKRIIGFPGETVSVKDGLVSIQTVDGEVVSITEPYVSFEASHSFRGLLIPENEYFVMGDNRNKSSDSRAGWTVPDKNIIGKAWIVLWPPSQFGLAGNYPLTEQIATTATGK